MSQRPTDAPWHDAWGSVDDTTDPKWFVEYLDFTRQRLLAQIQRDPTRHFAYLEPHPGQRILDVGTGTGVLVHELSRLVAPNGKVVGIDKSHEMVEAAKQRAEGKKLPLDFQQMDATNLDFPDNSFDSVLCTIVLVHVPNPEAAVREMVRVAKPGGIVCVSEQDWDTLVMDCGDPEVTRRVTDEYIRSVPSGRVGRQLYSMFLDAGLQEVVAIPAGSPAFGEEAKLWSPSPRELAKRARAAGAISQEEETAWLADLEARYASDRLFISVTAFRALGRKPE